MDYVCGCGWMSSSSPLAARRTGSEAQDINSALEGLWPTTLNSNRLRTHNIKLMPPHCLRSERAVSQQHLVSEQRVPPTHTMNLILME